MRAICRALADLSPRSHKASVALELGRIAGQKTAAQIQPGEIAQLLADWKLRVSTATQRTYSVTLRNALRWLNRPDLAELVPKIRKPRSHPPIAAAGEIERLTAVAPAWLRAYILLASQAGLRRSDALAVSEAHVRDGIIHLIQFKTKAGDLRHARRQLEESKSEGRHKPEAPTALATPHRSGQNLRSHARSPRDPTIPRPRGTRHNSRIPGALRSRKPQTRDRPTLDNTLNDLCRSQQELTTQMLNFIENEAHRLETAEARIAAMEAKCHTT